MPVEDALVALGAVTEDQAGAVMAEELGLPYIFPQADAVDRDLVRRFPAATLRRLRAVPLVSHDGCVRVAASSPLDAGARRELEALGGGPVALSLASPRRIDALLNELAPGGPPGAKDLEAVTLLYGHVARAIQAGAAEVRLEPDDGAVVVRYRLGAHLAERARLPLSSLLALAARARALDGEAAAFRLPPRGRSVGVNVSVLPTRTGESIRIAFSPLTPLRLTARQHQRLRRIAARRRGLVVITAPEPARLAYVILRMADPVRRSIVTVERRALEPERAFRQVEAGDAFDAALSAALAYRPDVLFAAEPPERPSLVRALAHAAEGALVVAASPDVKADILITVDGADVSIRER